VYVGGDGIGGDGGRAISSSITGSSVARGGGGGGGASGTAGLGRGGGANGVTGTTDGLPGTVNRGGGGGGSAYFSKIAGSRSGGAGGSGVVIIRYPNIYGNLTVGAGLTFTGPTTVGEYKVYQFTSGSGSVTFNA
jgi:hypothetical protein